LEIAKVLRRIEERGLFKLYFLNVLGLELIFVKSQTLSKKFQVQPCRAMFKIFVNV